MRPSCSSGSRFETLPLIAPDPIRAWTTPQTRASVAIVLSGPALIVTNRAGARFDDIREGPR